MTKTDIIKTAENTFTCFSETCKSIDEHVFFKKPDQKWSVAENVQHLIISTNTTSLAWYLPLFLVRWIGGKPNRNSRSYDELKDKYNKKLSEGGRASGRFVPKPIEINYGKQTLLDNWTKATSKFICTLNKNRSEQDLDNYLVKHPLLGRITLRELAYFTIFHTEHHLHSIQKPLKPHDPVL
jgi:hypothetical protein